MKIKLGQVISLFLREENELFNRKSFYIVIAQRRTYVTQFGMVKLNLYLTLNEILD